MLNSILNYISVSINLIFGIQAAVISLLCIRYKFKEKCIHAYVLPIYSILGNVINQSTGRFAEVGDWIFKLARCLSLIVRVRRFSTLFRATVISSCRAWKMIENNTHPGAFRSVCYGRCCFLKYTLLCM